MAFDSTPSFKKSQKRTGLRPTQAPSKKKLAIFQTKKKPEISINDIDLQKSFEGMGNGPHDYQKAIHLIGHAIDEAAFAAIHTTKTTIALLAHSIPEQYVMREYVVQLHDPLHRTKRNQHPPKAPALTLISIACCRPHTPGHVSNETL